MENTDLGLLLGSCRHATAEDWIPGYIGPANTLVAQNGGKYLARTAGSNSHHFLIESKDDLA